VIGVLDNLEQNLTLATIDENWKHRLGRQTELRYRFNAPDLTVRQLGHFQIINIDGQEITIGSMATDEQIAAEIAKIRQITEKPMSITGLQSGTFKTLLEDMRKQVAEAQNQGAAKVVAAKDNAVAQVSAAVEGVVAKVDREVSEALQDFSEFTNGGPA